MYDIHIPISRKDGFTSKPHNSFFSETHFIAEIDIDMAMLNNVSKSHTTRSVLQIQFVNIKHIEIRRNFDQHFVSAEHSRK